MNRSFKFQVSSFQRVAVAVLFFTTLFFGEVHAQNVAAEFDAANKLFERGQFADAAASYEKLINQGTVSAAIWFNLGNARFRQSELGRAIAAYRNASVLAPRDPDIRANLAFARAAVPGNSAVKDSLVERALAAFSLNEWAAVAAGMLWIWFGLLALRQFKASFKTTQRTALISVGIALAVAVVLLSISFIQAQGRSGVVVVSDQTPVRFGPLAESQVAFTARDGAEYPILERKDNWLMIVDPSRKTGWLEAGRVAVVSGY